MWIVGENGRAYNMDAMSTLRVKSFNSYHKHNNYFVATSEVAVVGDSKFNEETYELYKITHTSDPYMTSDEAYEVAENVYPPADMLSDAHRVMNRILNAYNEGKKVIKV